VSYLINRVQEIKKKGFSMTPADTENINPFVPVDFSKVQIGTKKVEDAIYELGDFKKANPRFGDKKVVLDAI
jgi:hypothetical protein